MAYRYIRDTWRLYDEPEETPLGFKMIGNSLMQKGQYEPDETQIFSKIISQVDIFVNIGANIGYYCCIALHHGKHVIAFEPSYHNLLYLLRNIKANNWISSIEIYPLALGNTVGVVEIFGGGAQGSLIKGWGGRPNQYVTLVPSSTLDNVLGSRFKDKQCFVLVDIEGAEYAMLQHASSFIDRNPKPIWMIEISVSEHQPTMVTINPNLLATFQIFWDMGYEAWTADKHWRLVHFDEIERIVDGGTDTLSTHNILFIEKGKNSLLL